MPKTIDHDENASEESNSGIATPLYGDAQNQNAQTLIARAVIKIVKNPSVFSDDF